MLKKVFTKTKYEACILFFLLMQLIVFAPTKDGMPVWQLLTYLGDYSHGFMPRAFIGEIISWFTDSVSSNLLFNLSFTVCVLLSVAAALIGGYLIKNAENKTAVTAIVAVMVSSPIFMPLMASWLGITDIYLILLTFIAFVFNENKFLRYLVPVLALICTAIHHAYLFLYMVPIAIALLYDFFKNKKYIRDGIMCGVTYASLIALGLITVKTRSASGFASVDEMTDFMINKAGFSLEKEWLESLVPNEYFTRVDYLQQNVTSTMSASNLFGIVLIFAPLFVTFAYGWIKSIKQSEDKTERFIFSLCLIHPLSTVPTYIFGLNWNRWTSAIITSQCILYLFMLYRKNKTLSNTVGQMTEFFKKHFILVVFYLIYFASFAKLLGT
ncbi:MAG: hypothetical protein IJ447_09050 [Clostridia bacterium]|nr:hypothetical protein [Clostridia bacterium]